VKTKSAIPTAYPVAVSTILAIDLEDSMLQGEVPGFESTTWQPDYLRQHATEQSEYLDKVTANDVIWQVAECAMELLAMSAGAKVLELGCGRAVVAGG
jgi:hypothetical protein